MSKQPRFDITTQNDPGLDPAEQAFYLCALNNSGLSHTQRRAAEGTGKLRRADLAAAKREPFGFTATEQPEGNEPATFPDLAA